MSRTSTRSLRSSVLAEHWPIVAVVACFVASGLFLPRADVPVGDDWFYARTVDMLVRGEGFHILDATVVTLILPALWGGLFAHVFGMSFVVLRWSSVIFVAVGGVAAYALCRMLGASRRWSALAAALVLFNPLGYVLSNSFMSDSPFTALLSVAALLYVKGLATEGERRRLVLAASVAAAGAFLIRQQGALIPLAVAANLLTARQLRFDRRSVWLVLRIGGIPAATGAAYLAWLRLVHGTPASQHLFIEESGFLFERGMIGLGARLVFLCLVYGGLFVLPIAAVALLASRRVLPSVSRRGWLLFAAPAAFVVLLAIVFSREDRLMPYVPQYLASWGLGPADLIGGRPEVLTHDLLVVFTAACLVATLVMLLVLSRAAAPRPSRFGASGARVLLAILVGQVIGIVPPSLHFQNPVPAAVLVFTLDRYLLPILPLIVCLVVWAVADLRLPSWPAWVVTAGLGAAAVAGTHDFLVFQDAVFEASRDAQRAGVPTAHLDGGAQWDAAYLYRDGVEVPESLPNRPWWVNQFAWDLDARYVIASAPIPHYVEVSSSTYDTWLPPGDKRLFLLRRDDVQPPP